MLDKKNEPETEKQQNPEQVPEAKDPENRIVKNTKTNQDYFYIRDPFSQRSSVLNSTMTKQSKRTQRYRSTAKSRILGMSVGDIRYSFNQLRAAGDSLTSQLVLYNGQTAGEFALSYLIETSNSMRKRRRRKKDVFTEDKDSDVSDKPPTLPESQLPLPGNNKRDKDTTMKFS